jgi:hypothetical protein
MLFRMAFKITDDNYLQVKAFAKGIQNLSAVHLNPDVFSTAVRIAGIPEPTASELQTAAKTAYIQGASDVCCELVELNRPQLEVLRLVSTEGESAWMCGRYCFLFDKQQVTKHFHVKRKWEGIRH